MFLKELVEGLDIVSVKGRLDIEIGNIAHDSRLARAGSLFVCIEGFKADGHKYVPYALNNGAAALLTQKDVEVPDGITVVRVKDTRYGLAHVSDAFFGHPSGKFDLIGVTGTKGKTTTTYMIKAVLDKLGQNVGLIGSIANRIGNEVIPTERTTPESYDLQALFAEMAEKKVNNVVMEVSSQGLELHRVSCSDFKIGVFTNFSQDHLGTHEHKSMEDYFNAKMKLFKMCRTGLVNIDSSCGEDVLKRADCRVYTYGIDKAADIRAVDVVTHQDSVDFNVLTPWGNESIKVNIPGKFSVYNALAAIGVCLMQGVGFETIKEGLKNVSVPGRAEIIETGRNFTVMTDYAHTPDSLQNILSTVKAFAKGRVICVFGCGGDRDRTKRPIMGEISGKIADFTIITSDNPRTEEPEAIIRDIEEGMKRTGSSYLIVADRREAIKYAINNAIDNDIIVLAGKGHETYQIFKDKTIHFDEREVVKEILEDLKYDKH